MKKKQWQIDYEKLIISITDEKDLDGRRSLIEEGFKSEERARELTQFIKDNNIDCRGCFDGNHERYLDYKKLLFKEAETWEIVNEWGED